jgi:hypothetical protein
MLSVRVRFSAIQFTTELSKSRTEASAVTIRRPFAVTNIPISSQMPSILNALFTPPDREGSHIVYALSSLPSGKALGPPFFRARPGVDRLSWSEA